MPERTARKKAAYEDLYELPDNMVGEIVDGEIVATPRPLYKHGKAASRLGMKIGGPFDLGDGGGPGGWWIIYEPEVHLGEDVLVPDLGGWRQERMPEIPEGHWTDLAPDWVCEVLSPNTLRLDRVKKMPIYARGGVPFLWMLDPQNRSLEVFRLESGRWVLLGTHADEDRVLAEPFHEVALDLGVLWA